MREVLFFPIWASRSHATRRQAGRQTDRHGVFCGHAHFAVGRPFPLSFAPKEILEEIPSYALPLPLSVRQTLRRSESADPFCVLRVVLDKRC